MRTHTVAAVEVAVGDKLLDGTDLYEVTKAERPEAGVVGITIATDIGEHYFMCPILDPLVITYESLTL